MYILNYKNDQKSEYDIDDIYTLKYKKFENNTYFCKHLDYVQYSGN